MNVIKKYWNHVYQYILLLTPCACMCAGLVYTTGKIMGWYPESNWLGILLFDSSQIVYLLISLNFIHRKKQVSYYSERDIFLIKLYITVSLFIQYNFIIHLFPTTDTWCCTFIFMGFVTFLFDLKLMLVHIAGYTTFLIIGHVLYWEQFVSFPADTLISVLSFRIVVYILTSLSFIFITFFVEKFLLQEQEQEAENIFLMQKQLEYYQNCDMLDKELRKFRHDIKGHFISMGYLLEHENYKELTGYFNDLNDSFSLPEKMYFSGNLIIDSIMNYDLHNACSPHVHKKVCGVLCEITTVSALDLCTVFSNLLSNAIHAANLCEEQASPLLNIHFDYGSEFFSISIINTTHNDYLASPTVNRRNRNHGYGIHKIKAICEKHDGVFHQSRDSQYITTTIYLPI